MLRNALILLALVAAGAALGGYLVLRNGLAADRPPGRIETAVARRLLVLSIPASTRAMRNPRAADVDAWRAGADHFAEHCAVCHGTDGRGATEFGPRMYPPVPNLASADVQSLSDGALFAIVQNGVRWTGMPAFRSEHSAEETWDLVSFIRRLPDLKPDDENTTHHEHAAEPAAPHVVRMDGTAFVPAEMTVAVGETVTWTNADPFPHNVASAKGGFKSGDLDPDRSWKFHAGKPGRFDYVCTLHPGMKGTLIVQPRTERSMNR